MKLLNHLNFLITRPTHQTESLTSTIQAYGGKTISFPTLELIAINKEKALTQLRKLTVYDFVIFISPNAVFKLTDSIRQVLLAWPERTKTIAMGPGTIKALKQYNLPVNYYPKANFSSEGLLALLPLQNPKQKNILIFQGKNGREYLNNVLKKRGAYVTTVNNYKRQCPRGDKKSIPYPSSVDVILCTSNTGLKNLLTLLYPYWHTTLLNKQLLVISPRIAAYAKKLGFVKLPLISDNASDEAILQTLSAYAKSNF